MNDEVSRDAICTRCRGIVKVPPEVTWSKQLKIYSPPAECMQCGVGYRWHTKRNPTSGQIPVYNDLYDIWFGDRPLSAIPPKVNNG